MPLTEGQVKLAAYAYGLHARRIDPNNHFSLIGWMLYLEREQRVFISDRQLAHAPEPWIYLVQRCRSAAGEMGPLFALAAEAGQE